jgi:hypothetical protein
MRGLTYGHVDLDTDDGHRHAKVASMWHERRIGRIDGDQHDERVRDGSTTSCTGSTRVIVVSSFGRPSVRCGDDRWARAGL